MFQQVPIRGTMGQMQFISPQMGPSMAPAFAFNVQGGPVPVPVAPAQPVVAPPPIPVGPVEVVAPAVRYNDWVVPTVALAAVALIVGLSL